MNSEPFNFARRVSPFMALTCALLVAGCQGPHTVEQRWPSGRLRERKAVRTVRRGGADQVIIDGPLRQWHQNGRLALEGTYLDGSAEGRFVSWFDDGGKSGEGSFKSGKPDGDWVRLYPSGDRRIHGHFVDGKKNGTFVWWYPSGRKEMQGEYFADRKNGLWTRWNESGAEIGREIYMNGEKQD